MSQDSNSIQAVIGGATAEGTGQETHETQLKSVAKEAGSIRRKKRQLDLGSPTTITQDKEKIRRQNQMEPMEQEEVCTRCETALNGLLLKCASCRRHFHAKCKTADEALPCDDPPAPWTCRVCSTPGALKTADMLMTTLDKTPLESETMNYVAFLVTHIRKLEQQVSSLSEKLAPFSTSPAVATSPAVSPSANNAADGSGDAKRPSKTVLLIGDKKSQKLAWEVKDRFSRKNSIVVRTFSKHSTQKILEQARAFLDENPQPVHLVLHTGYEECMEFEKDKLLTPVKDFVQKLKTTRPNCSISLVTIPQFSKECREANQALLSLKDEMDETRLDVIDLSRSHRLMVNKGSYSYSGKDELLISCANNLARRVGTFLGVNPTTRRVQTAEPVEDDTRTGSRPAADPSRRQESQPTERKTRHPKQRSSTRRKKLNVEEDRGTSAPPQIPPVWMKQLLDAIRAQSFSAGKGTKLAPDRHRESQIRRGLGRTRRDQ